MLKVTIYDGPMGTETSYIEGVEELGGKRKVEEIYAGKEHVLIVFTNKEEKIFTGFRSITDKIHDPKTTKGE